MVNGQTLLKHLVHFGELAVKALLHRLRLLRCHLIFGEVKDLFTEKLQYVHVVFAQHLTRLWVEAERVSEGNQRGGTMRHYIADVSYQVTERPRK